MVLISCRVFDSLLLSIEYERLAKLQANDDAVTFRKNPESVPENCVESCFRGKGCMARRDEGAYPQRSVTEEQRSQAALSPKTLRAAGLLSVAGVGSLVTAHCGDAPPSPPWPQPKSLAAGL